MMWRSIALTLAGCALASMTPASHGSVLELDEGPVTVGQGVEVRVVPPRAGAVVELEIRPGSRLARRERLDLVAPWTPLDAGLVRLRLLDEAGVELDRADLAVRYRRRPASAMLVLALAAGLLFAGVVVGLRRSS